MEKEFHERPYDCQNLIGGQFREPKCNGEGRFGSRIVSVRSKKEPWFPSPRPSPVGRGSGHRRCHGQFGVTGFQVGARE